MRRPAGLPFVLAGALSLVASQASGDPASAAHKLLSDRCVSCHGPEKQKGGLRLDSREGLLAGGDSGAVIVLSNATASLLYSNVAGLNPDSVMPPKGERLTTNEVALLVSWINSGAPWPADATTQLAKSGRSEEHTSELQSQSNLVCRLLLEKKKKNKIQKSHN